MCRPHAEGVIGVVAIEVGLHRIVKMILVVMIKAGHQLMTLTVVMLKSGLMI